MGREPNTRRPIQPSRPCCSLPSDPTLALVQPADPPRSTPPARPCAPACRCISPKTRSACISACRNWPSFAERQRRPPRPAQRRADLLLPIPAPRSANWPRVTSRAAAKHDRRHRRPFALIGRRRGAHRRWPIPTGRPARLDKWFAAPARDPSEQALGGVLGLTAHPDFDGKNPNRLRALVSTFANFNPSRFHDERRRLVLADQILVVDSFNPMTAARLVEPLGGWRRYAGTGRATRSERPDRGDRRTFEERLRACRQGVAE